MNNESVCHGAPANPPPLVGHAWSSQICKWNEVSCLFGKRWWGGLVSNANFPYHIVSLLWYRAIGIRWQLNGNSVKGELSNHDSSTRITLCLETIRFFFSVRAPKSKFQHFWREEKQNKNSDNVEAFVLICLFRLSHTGNSEWLYMAWNI